MSIKMNVLHGPMCRFCYGFAAFALMVTVGCYYGNNQNEKKTIARLTALLVLSNSNTIADYRVARESVLRSIPQSAIDAAKNNLKIYFFHTSHGSRVVTGMSGLLNYKSGDSAKFAFTSGGSPVSGSLYFQEAGYDLSANEGTWDASVRTYLNAHPEINVVMGSWCDPADHDHYSYITRMEALIAEYPTITFVFMTGHPNGDGENLIGNTAYHCHATVAEHCRTHNRYCIDYWSIETHGMDDVYYPYANDDGESGSTDFYGNWIGLHTIGEDYYSCSCAHADQPVTFNRIAYAAWWIWARIAGWSGV